MTTLLLFVITLCSFLFYGVVGEDKTWLLAPAFMFSYVLITIALLKRALDAGRWGAGEKDRGQRTEVRGRRAEDGGQTSDLRLPTSGSLWLLFLLYGVALIPHATVPFEAKLTLLFLGSVVGAYLVWGGELTTFKDNRVLLGLLVFIVMLAALYGLIVHFKCPDQVLWTDRYAEYKGRLASTYICPNHFAHLMQMLLPFCLALLFIPQAGIYLKLLSAYSFLAFLPTLYLTESRAGWLGSMAAVGVTVCLMALRRSKKLFALLIILVPLCSILLLLGGWRYSETFQRRMKPVVEFLEGQADEGIGSESRDFRPQTWMDTIDMIREKPLIGFGPGNYRYTFPEHRNRFQGQRIVTGHPHNEYLELMADYGLIGFGLFAIAWIYGLVLILVKSLKADETRHAFLGFAFVGTAAGTMVHSFFDFEMHVYPNALVFALLAALSCGPLFYVKRKGARRRAQGLGKESGLLQSVESPATPNNQRTTHLRRAGAWLLAVGYMLAALLCFQIMSSSLVRALGDEASAVRNIGKGERYYQWAVKIDPSNWRAYKGLAQLVYDQRYHSLDRAEKILLASEEREWYQRACLHNAHDPEILMGLGASMIFLGRAEDGGQRAEGGENLAPQSPNLEDEGLALLREACGYRKFNDNYWWRLGVELRKAGRFEEALEVFKYTETIKRTPSTKKNIQWLEAQLGNGQQTPPDSGQPPASQLDPAALRLQGEDMDLSELLDLMEK